MPSVVDSFIVELGLDPATFNKGQRDALSAFKKTQEEALKGAQNVESSAKRVAEAYSMVQGKVLGLISILVGGRGLKEFVTHVIGGDAALGRLSKTLNTSVADLSAWGGASHRFGGSVEGTVNSIQGLVREFQTFKITGQSSILPYFRALGVQIEDVTTGKMRPMNDILLDLADKFSKMDPAMAATFGHNLGFDEGTINLLLRGRVGVAGIVAEQKKLNAITKESSDRAEKLAADWRQLEQASEGLGRELLTITVPALTAVTKALGEGLKSLHWQETPEGRKAAEDQGEKLHEDLVGRFGEPPAWLRSLFGLEAEGPGVQPKSLPSKTGPAVAGSRNSLANSPFGNLIARGEGTYNTVNLGQRGRYASASVNLENMTLADVMAAQRAGQFNAAGRYQITRDTLSAGSKALGLSGSERFDRALQDKLFEQYLVGIKRKEISDYLSGRSNDLKAAVLATSKEWASVANPATGQSYYAGVANNKSSISADEVSQALQAVRAANQAAGARGALSGVVGAGAISSSFVDSRASNTIANDTKIGAINVNVPGGDAEAIGRGIEAAINRVDFTTHANYGAN